jgi:hypothetical protein
VFFVQCELNFQNKTRSFRLDRAKVNFAQSYLKGMALEYFEPDLLSGATDVRPDWMDDYTEFMLELQNNFGPHDPVGMQRCNSNNSLCARNSASTHT